MNTSRINVMDQVILLHTKLCKMYRVYCLNYIFNESQVSIKDTNFVTSLLWCDQLFLERAQTIKYFYTHCKLLKIIIQDMLFPTKLTSLINIRGLIDSASLKIITITNVTVGATSDLKLFWGSVHIKDGDVLQLLNDCIFMGHEYIILQWSHMSAIMSQITSPSTVVSTACWEKQQMKYKDSALLAPCEGNPSLAELACYQTIAVSGNLQTKFQSRLKYTWNDRWCFHFSFNNTNLII